METTIDSAYKSVLMDGVTGVLKGLSTESVENPSSHIMDELHRYLEKSKYGESKQGALFFHLVEEAVTNLPRDEYVEKYQGKNVGRVILELGMETVSKNVENWKKSLGA